MCEIYVTKLKLEMLNVGKSYMENITLEVQHIWRVCIVVQRLSPSL